jgi:large subunit ribosomal protein L31e
MAEEEELERIFTIPLREVKKVPKTKRTNHTIIFLKKYIARHMKGEISNVWIDEPVNRKLWSRGRTNPPQKIRVKAVKFEDDLIEVTLPEE